MESPPLLVEHFVLTSHQQIHPPKRSKWRARLSPHGGEGRTITCFLGLCMFEHAYHARMQLWQSASAYNAAVAKCFCIRKFAHLRCGARFTIPFEGRVAIERYSGLSTSLSAVWNWLTTDSMSIEPAQNMQSMDRFISVFKRSMLRLACNAFASTAAEWRHARHRAFGRSP